MKTYEAVFILDERQFTDGGDAFAEEVVNHIETLGGRVRKKESMGRKQFARPIKKQKSGIYWDFEFDMDPASVNAVSEQYRLNPAVFRVGVFTDE